MSLVDFGQIAIASIISAGGIGAIIVGTVHFSANLIADRLSKKYEAKLIQENEKYKSEISKKEYVSKTRFDTVQISPERCEDFVADGGSISV